DRHLPPWQRLELPATPYLEYSDRAAMELRPFVAAGRPHHVLITALAGAVDAEVETGIGEVELDIDAVGGRVGGSASLAPISPVTHRTSATPRSVAAARTP